MHIESTKECFKITMALQLTPLAFQEYRKEQLHLVMKGNKMTDSLLWLDKVVKITQVVLIHKQIEEDFKRLVEEE